MQIIVEELECKDKVAYENNGKVSQLPDKSNNLYPGAILSWADGLITHIFI